MPELILGILYVARWGEMGKSWGLARTHIEAEGESS